MTSRTATFSECLANISSIQERFDKHLPGAQIINDTIVCSVFGKTIQASNQLFTAPEDAPTEQDNHFQTGVDPLGHLAVLKRRDLIHAPDNIVKYFARIIDTESR